MKPYSTITPRDVSVGIKKSAAQMLGYVQSALDQCFKHVNTEGFQQDILDELEDPQRELANYALMQSTLAIISGPATPSQKLGLLSAIQSMIQSEGIPLGTSSPAADLERFVPQQDGSVLFVPPPEPEPEGQN